MAEGFIDATVQHYKGHFLFNECPFNHRLILTKNLLLQANQKETLTD